MKQKFTMLAMAGIVAMSVVSVQSQPYYVAGSALTPAWTPGTPENQMTGGPAVYSLTQATTANSYHEFKITGASWSDPNFPNDNVKIKGDANGTNTFYFYPGTIVDGWFPLANRIGYADPGNMTWEVAGDFTTPNWDSDPNAQMVNQGNGLYTLTYIVPTAGTHQFKFRSTGAWDTAIGADFGNGPNNASVTTTQANQSVKFQLDLPNGRWLAGSPPPPPVTNQVIFAVDMTYQIQFGYFHPGSSVYVAGAFNGWPAASTGTGLLLVNDPAYQGGANTNIYYGTNTFIGLPNSEATRYKFNQNDSSALNSGWETSSDRSLVLMSSNGTLRLPVAVFSDLFPTEILSAPTPVLFTVDMNGAVGTDAHVFDPNADSVYVNGIFAGWYAWAGGINPSPAPPGYQLFQQGSSGIFTNTIILPAGTPVSFEYKYGMDPNAINAGPLDDEAAFGQNHRRVVRSTALNPYPLPTDTFGRMYQEPYFSAGNTAGGRLTVGAPAAGKVPVSWLGRPGAHLQVNSSLTGGTWQDLNNTDGSSWSAGFASTNGLVSVTNWPIADKAFFRLVKP
jgi:hypothetical protein